MMSAKTFLPTIVVGSILLADTQIGAFAPRHLTTVHFQRGTANLNGRNAASSACFMTTHPSALRLSDSADRDQTVEKVGLRGRLRKMTGFSLTALRKTMRAATGVSLTAIYASTLAVTGAWIRQTMRVILSPFPAWFRYFIQPFLVLYYTPLFVLRNLTGPTRKRARSTHEHFVDGWKEAIETADKKSSYWPIHLESDGSVRKDMDEVDMREAIAESVEIAMEDNKEVQQTN